MKQISFSGTHGTGKSTSAAFEYRNQKIQNPDKSVHLICNTSAMCPFPINMQATEESQSWRFANQIQFELQASSRFDILVTDRTIVDVIAYTYVAGFEGLACGMLDYAHHYVHAYDVIRVKQAKFNQFFHNDGIRDTDPVFRDEVESVLKSLYKQLQDAGAINGSLYFV